MKVSKKEFQKKWAVVTKNDAAVADQISRYVEEGFTKVFGTEPVHTIAEFIKSKGPFFGATTGKIESLQEKLGQSVVEDLKKEIAEIEDNMTDNLDIVVESIEELKKRVEQGQQTVKQILLDQTKEGLKLVASAKWQSSLDELSKLKSDYQKIKEVSKTIVKEKNTLEIQVKSLKEKNSELTAALSEVKERESKHL